jgi:asparagine synthase (glutamine-hydrolysing)
MAHSLEIRTPLVDSTLLRTLAPVVGRLRPGEGKQALAAAPSIPLPDSIANRGKTGFVVPTAAWRARHLQRPGQAAPSKGSVSRLWAGEVFAPSRRPAAPRALEAAA